MKLLRDRRAIRLPIGNEDFGVASLHAKPEHRSSPMHASRVWARCGSVICECFYCGGGSGGLAECRIGCHRKKPCRVRPSPQKLLNEIIASRREWVAVVHDDKKVIPRHVCRPGRRSACGDGANVHMT